MFPQTEVNWLVMLKIGHSETREDDSCAPTSTDVGFSGEITIRDRNRRIILLFHK